MERMAGTDRRHRAYAKALAIAGCALLIAGMLAILIAGTCARPAADDFAFAAYTRGIWRESGSIGATVLGAATYAYDVYTSWQGSFSACFLMALEPGLFGESLYGLGTALLVTAFLLGNALFFDAFFRRLLGFTKWETAAVGSVATLLMAQLLPSAAESFYWFNGSVYYTFYFSLSQIMAAGLCRAAFTSKRGFSASFVFLPLLACFIGGGNLVTGLTLAVLFLGYFLWQAIKKRPEPVSIFTGAGFYLGFLLNVAAPGNAVRMGANGAANGPIRAILLAVAHTLRCADQWTGIAVLIGLVLLAPILLRRARGTGFAFPWPLAVTAASVLLVAVGFTPQFYAQGIIAGYRSMNIAFFQWIILLILNLFYYLGWGYCRFSDRATRNGRLKRIALPAVCCAAAYLGLHLVSARYPIYEKVPAAYTSVAAARLVHSGEAERYASERDAWLAILDDPTVRDARLPKLTVFPAELAYDRLRPDPDFWINRNACYYYQKDTIRIIAEETDDKG